MSTRARAYAITIHNVYQTDESFWAQLAKNLNGLESVCSLEPYPDHAGYHFHIFIRFKNPQSKFALLSTIQSAQGDVHIDDSSDSTEGMKGRVHIEVMRGTMSQATAYLTQDLTKKDKPCGVPILVKKDIFELKCSSCEFRGMNLDWFQENSSGGRQLCHNCCFKRDRENDSFSLGEVVETYMIKKSKYQAALKYLKDNNLV